MDTTALFVILSIVSVLLYLLGNKLFPSLNSTKNWMKNQWYELTIGLIVLVISLLITSQPIGNLIFLGASWGTLTYWFRKQNTHYLIPLALIFFGYTLYNQYILDNQQHISIVWTCSLMAWLFALTLHIVSISLQKIKWLEFIVLCILGGFFFIIPISFLGYFISEDSALKQGQINAILQTNFSESIEYVQSHDSLLIYLFFIFTSAAILTTAFVVSKKEKPFLPNQFYLSVILAITLAYANTFNHLPSQEVFVSTYVKYTEELEKFKLELAKRKDIPLQSIKASKKESGETYIVVIGESHNKNHMSLYGYYRNTTPKLDSIANDSNLLVFTQTYSNHVHTIPVLTHALTEVSKTNDMPYFEAISLIDIQRAAGFETYWLSNQVAYGDWDNPVSALAELVDHRINFNTSLGTDLNTQSYDEVILPELKKILNTSSEKNKVIYIHLMGSHGAYDNRHPRAYRKYIEEFEKGNTGAYGFWANHINHYDNSVYYNDFVLSQVIKSAISSKNSTSVLYFADHSEEIRYNKGHDMGKYTFSMSETPMLMYLSPEFKKRYPEKTATLASHTARLFTNDYVFELVNGLTGIETNYGDSTKDFSKGSYTIDPFSVTMIHNETGFYDEANTGYFQPRNLKEVNSLKPYASIIPHRVNTIGKLHEVQFNNAQGFEIDVMFRQTNDSNFFEVGHDEGSATKMALHTLLNEVDFSKIQKIWLDIKYVADTDIEAILKHLDKLNSSFPLKNVAIIETNITSSNLSQISNAGYHTSYYVPTHFKDYPLASQKQEAAKILNQIKAQNLSAISFDHELYTFVQQHISPNVKQDLSYHTWNISLGYFQANIAEKLKEQPYFSDPRMKTILIKYKSDFEI